MKKNVLFLTFALLSSIIFAVDSSDLKLLKKAAKAGDANALFQLGERYEAGNGITKDIGTAIEYYRKAADKGNVYALYKMGDVYYFSWQYEDYVKSDVNLAFDYYRKAGEAGYGEAWNQMGFLVESIAERRNDFDAETKRKYLNNAINFYQKATEAKMEYDYAFVKIADIYFEQFQDYPRAAAYYEKASNKGYEAASLALGKMYLYGQGVNRNYQKAFALFKSIAGELTQKTGGHPSELTFEINIGSSVKGQAQYFVGYMYENGFGVARNLSLARSWYQASADKDIEDAEVALKRIGRN